jgi:hypothetical protein
MRDLILSVAIYPRWVSLFFFNPQDLPDPDGLLRGSGTMVRHLVLGSPADLERPAVRTLIRRAVAGAEVPLDAAQPGRLVIKSVSARQRARRPASSVRAGASKATRAAPAARRGQ